jgi:hypothetical protein
MIMKGRFYATFFVCFSFLLMSQEKTERSWFLKTDLISYFPNFGFNTGKANVEFELPLKNRETSVSLNLAYIYSYGATSQADYLFIEQKRTTGFSAKGEYRIYLGRRTVIEPLCLLIWPLATQLNNTKEKYTGLYLSGQTGFTQQWITMNEEYSEPLTEIKIFPDFIPNINLRVGFQSVSPNSVVVDQSLGLGIQYSFTPYNRYAGLFPLVSYSLKVGLAH